MAVDKVVEIKGLDEIDRRLKALPEKLRRRAIRQALKNGTEIVRSAAERIVKRSKYAPHLANNIATKISVTAKEAHGIVGVNTKVPHGHLLEFGTKPHKIGPRQHPGGEKHPFMRPAYDSQGDASVDQITSDLAKAVELEI